MAEPSDVSAAGECGSVGSVLCMMRSSWGSVDARVAPVMVLGVVCVGVALFMILVSLFMFVGGVVFGG